MILVDSSAWIEYLRGADTPVDRYLRSALEREEPLATTGVVLLEVLAGARDEPHARKLARLLGRCRLLAAQEPSDHEAAASLYRRCRQKGITIRRPPDLLIAAIAIRADAPLLHFDSDFDAIATHAPLRLVDPSSHVRGRRTVIAIDGPAGAGKSTVARALAAHLGFTYLDSGAMYRCVGLLSLEDPGLSPATLARAAHIELGQPTGEDERPSKPNTLASCVLLDGRDVTEAIRTQRVSDAASRVAAEPGVREALVAKQREMMAEGDWVAEGRDVGTVVAPHAELKIYLTADPAERARRRAAELGGDPVVVMGEQALRDERDATRAHSPLRAADDAVELDTTGLSVDAVVGRIVALLGDVRS